MFGLNPWLLVAIGVALATTNGATFFYVTSAERTRCQADELRAALAAVRLDLVASQAAVSVAEAAQRTLTTEAEAAQRSIAEYERTLQARAACDLSADDIAVLERLRLKSAAPQP